MKKVLIFFALIIVVAGIAAFCATRWVENRPAPNEVAAHEWLHRELKLTDAQHDALKPIEAKFTEHQRSLANALREANVQLAKAMGEEKHYTPRVASAVEHVHHCMGDLQKASIEHVFEMRAVLSPEQGEKLLKLAQQSLEQSP